MNKYDFLRDRLKELRVELNDLPVSTGKYLVGLADLAEAAIKLDLQWPTLIESQPELTIDMDDPYRMRYQFLAKTEMLMRQEYLERFGKEPPTSPLLTIWLASFSWHPDFNEEWVR